MKTTAGDNWAATWQWIYPINVDMFVELVPSVSNEKSFPKEWNYEVQLPETIQSSRKSQQNFLTGQTVVHQHFQPQNHHISTDLQWNLPIELCIHKINLKKQCEKDQLPKYMYGNNRIIFVGIHLWKTICSHSFCKMWNSSCIDCFQTLLLAWNQTLSTLYNN